MTRIPPSGPQPPTRGPEASPNHGKEKAKPGEGEGAFESLLQQKTDVAETLRRETMRSLRSHGGAGGPEKKKGKEEPPGFEGELRGKAEAMLRGESDPRVEARNPRGEDSGSEGGGKESPPEEPHSLRRFTGDVMIGDASFAAPQITPTADVAPPTQVVSKSDAVARIEQIADRIVDAVQVQMNPTGATEVRLELDLGKLGRVDVELARGADGNVRIELSTVNAVTREVIQDNLAALAERLDSRGLGFEQIAVQSPDQPAFHWQGSQDGGERRQQSDRDDEDEGEEA